MCVTWPASGASGCHHFEPPLYRGLSHIGEPKKRIIAPLVLCNISFWLLVFSRDQCSPPEHGGKPLLSIYIEQHRDKEDQFLPSRRSRSVDRQVLPASKHRRRENVHPIVGNDLAELLASSSCSTLGIILLPFVMAHLILKSDRIWCLLRRGSIFSSSLLERLYSSGRSPLLFFFLSSMARAKRFTRTRSSIFRS